MRLGVCNLRRTGRYTAPTPLFNSVWWIARPRTVSALKTPHTSPPCHPFVGVSSVIFPILFFSLPLYGGATHQLAELPDVCFRSKADISIGLRDVRFTPKSRHWNSVVQCLLCAKSGLMHCSKFGLAIGFWRPVHITTCRRAQCCRANEERSLVFATGQREDCSVECGSLSLAGLESGVSQPSFWPLFSFSTARLMKSCMLRFAFAGNSNAM